MEEIWKDIKVYEGRYQVSNMGNVRSMHYKDKTNPNIDSGVRLLKPIKKNNGYLVVSLLGKQTNIHRLVAETFIENPENKPCVDHINTIPTDNQVDNLRWVTYKENSRNINTLLKLRTFIDKKFAGKFGKLSVTHKKVFQYSLNGEFIREWDCMSDACRKYNIDSGSMTRCCKGLESQAKGYIWRYDKCNVSPVSLRIKAILQYDKNGVFIKEWNRITDAAKYYNTSTGRICSCLKGFTKSCKGFVWKYNTS